MGKLSHDALEKFVSDVLNKREPCPAMVLAWGWMLKQVRARYLTASRARPRASEHTSRARAAA